MFWRLLWSEPPKDLSSLFGFSGFLDFSFGFSGLPSSPLSGFFRSYNRKSKHTLSTESWTQFWAYSFNYCTHTHLYLWLVFSLVFVLLQRFLELLHLLRLFAFPPLLLPPLTTLLIAQTFALEFPPSSLFFLLLPESLKNIKTKCVRPAFSNVYTSRPELIYLFILQEVQQRSCFFSLNKGNDKNYSFCSAFDWKLSVFDCETYQRVPLI